MSTAGEGAAAENASAYENGGVGGKYRKRPNRRFQTTPYDRPPTALRNPSWLSKLVVDPASKLISAGAQRFFSSVFRKRLPPPPPASPPQPPEYRQESMNGHQESVPDNHARTQELAVYEGGNPSSSYDKNGVSELELLLNQKTFSRSEIDRLTRLLHSRAVDLSAKDAGKRIDANFSIQNATPHPMSDSVSLGQFPNSLEGNTIERARAHKVISNPTMGKALLEDGIASPTELAKAYMGSRSSEVSSSKLGLRSPLAREEAVLINTMPFASISPNTSLALKTTGHLGTPVNGSTPPRFHGRSAIYSMARTPYSRVHSTSIQQVGRSTSHGYTRPSSSAFQPAWNDGQLGSRPAALKRRSSVLDDDIGSVGPVRRIRQKHNLLTHGSSLSVRGMGLRSDVTQLQKLPLMDEAKNRVSNTASTSYAHVPPKSCEMAAKILEHLEKMTPKEKSSAKLAAARERSPVKLTENMLRGQALRSLEDLDASKFLENAPSDQKFVEENGSRDFAAQKQGRVEENGPTKSVIKSTVVVNADITVPIKDIKPSAVTADPALPKFVSQPSDRKRAFKMSAHEDFLELDDDSHSTGLTSESSDGRQGVMEKSMINGKSIPSKAVGLDKTPVYPELKTLSPAVLSKGIELATDSAAPAGEKHTGFTFSSSNVFSSSPQAALRSHSTLAADKPATVGDAPHFLSFGSKTVGEVPSSMESKAENSSSFVNASADPTNAPVEVLEFDKSGTKSDQQDRIVNGNSGTTSSLGSSSMSATISVFSTGAPSSDLVTNNGPLASGVFTWSSSSPFTSTKLADQNFTNCSSNMVTSSSATATFSTGGTSSSSATSNSGLSESDVAPSIFSATAFSVGSSKEPSISFPATSRVAYAGNTDLKVKAEKETSFGNSSDLSFGNTVPSVSPASSTFGLGSFISSSATSSQSQVSLNGSGSALSTQPSSAGSAITTVSESMPVQFGSPSSPLVFGSSGISSFTSSSIFGSSAPATAFSVSGTSSAQSSSASTTETNLVSSSVFNFGGGSSASASMSNAVTSSSGVTPATFTFGVSSAPSSTPSSSVAPGIYSFGASSSASSSATSGSSTTPAMFSFGASSVSSSSSGTSPSIFSFGASPSALSSGTNSVSSSGAISSPFGSSWQSTKSPLFGSTLNISSPSTGFSFGASSSSFGPTVSAPSVFGSTTGPSSSPIFPFSAASATTSSLSTSSTQTVFGNPTSAFAGTAGNNDQMNTEDSMAEDPVQSSTPVAPVFGQSPVTPSPQSFMFGSSVPSPAVSFQFGGQQNQAAPQNPSQFQASSSVEFNAGGSFSLGSAGPDKTGRRIVKINKNRNRKR